MAKKTKGAGFQQAAGLIRYFDAEEETALHIDPRLVMISSFLIGLVVILMYWFYPLA
ncbi:MAG TPA: preprotein translocase subunit Sec61beta [Candidatus Thermoplasmatota archaeon]|nr:preprotein translocase subunit Sec61beta [Candidatus Thermoplasmatota archaeon]